MEIIKSIFGQPFTWGLLVGLIFLGILAWHYWKLTLEFKRYKKYLSDKMELEAESYNRIKQDKEKLGQENENLRLKIGSFKDAPSRELERELEIFARAERRMILSAPGFAPAWESAKAAAMDEISQEERGKSLPQRLFRKLLKTGATIDVAEKQEAVKETAS